MKKLFAPAMVLMLSSCATTAPITNSNITSINKQLEDAFWSECLDFSLENYGEMESHFCFCVKKQHFTIGESQKESIRICRERSQRVNDFWQKADVMGIF